MMALQAGQQEEAAAKVVAHSPAEKIAVKSSFAASAVQN